MDFLTGETLVNVLVRPVRRVVEWASRIHGIHWGLIKEALAEGRAVNGWHEARARLFEHANTDTVLIGHALANDLLALGVTHDAVVDSSVLASVAVFGRGRKGPRTWSLRALASELCGMTVQANGGSGKVHDCLEDTYSTRQVVLEVLKYPSKLAKWADGARAILDRKAAEREAARLEAKRAEDSADSSSRPHEGSSLTGGDDVDASGRVVEHVGNQDEGPPPVDKRGTEGCNCPHPQKINSPSR